MSVMKTGYDGFSADELRLLSSLNTPVKIQDFLDGIDYNLELEGETCMSPLRVLRTGKANCIEGALFAAAALRFHGRKPLIADLTSVRDDDHVIAIFKHGGIGSIAKSKYPGLTYREPIHRNMRELALSYFEDYFNYGGEKTLRGFSNTIDLSIFDHKSWMTSEKDLFFMADYLNKIKHTALFGKVRLRPVTPIAKQSGELWLTSNGLWEKVVQKKPTLLASTALPEKRKK